MLTKTLIVVTGLAIASAGALWFGLNDSPVETAAAPNTRSQSAGIAAEAQRATPAADERTHQPARPAENFAAALARELAEEFGLRIDEIAIQARLYRIRQDVVERFPANGLNDFNTAIRTAFPDHAEAILALMDRLDRYNDWLDRETAALMDLAPLERHGALWAKRRELFGDDADLIWADERNELARKQEEVQSILAELNRTDHGTLGETLYQLNTRLKATLGEDLVQYGDANSVITNVFFGLDSVQDTLKRLPPEQRQDEIDAIRRRMGYSEEQVDRLRARDRKRNRRWDNGLNYMEERRRLTATLDADDRQQALSDLRERYFGHEAPTIEREEESGFFRYERPRVYGRN